MQFTMTIELGEHISDLNALGSVLMEVSRDLLGAYRAGLGWTTYDNGPVNDFLGHTVGKWEVRDAPDDLDAKAEADERDAKSGM